MFIDSYINLLAGKATRSIKRVFIDLSLYLFVCKKTMMIVVFCSELRFCALPQSYPFLSLLLLYEVKIENRVSSH